MIPNGRKAPSSPCIHPAVHDVGARAARCGGELRRVGGGSHPRFAMEYDRASLVRQIADPAKWQLYGTHNMVARVFVGGPNVDQSRPGFDRGVSF